MTLAVETRQSAIENGFPFEKLAEVAELESWRKEINRPIYHIHKWWAQRLGSVFRAILIAAARPKDADIMSLFYQKLSLEGLTVFDPFMGSGTTIGEASKLGARAVGRDINPVAVFAVQNALGEYSREEVLRTFCAIEKDLAETLKSFYVALLPDGTKCEALYYFWVKTIPCPVCNQSVDLFSSRIFSAHAYPTKHPEAKALCPACDAINPVNYDSLSVTCRQCGKSYNPQIGNAKGGKATCPVCRNTFQIAKTYLTSSKTPTHRLYAKMILTPSGEKRYLPADHFDHQVYENATLELVRRGQRYPREAIEPGYNTDQVLNYGYRYWYEMFNDRQLLCLSLLSERITSIPEPNIRNLFACLFSGLLEFNNMFTSFKGEGTGAVRHMFSHHILKPELMPLEANIWGTNKSSGAFSTLFKSRILKAIDYRENPFELKVIKSNGKVQGKKVFGLSQPLTSKIATTWPEFKATNAPLLISCGDSSKTDIDEESIDLVVTDPPFFDNVHYSQLADFFHVWLRHILGPSGMFSGITTRATEEVQQSDPSQFTRKLAAVLKECARVLKPDGLLVFTYHHSRPEGWQSLLRAVLEAGFIFSQAHPTKAEMSGAQPKSQAREPIDIDVILVCRKSRQVERLIATAETALEDAIAETHRKLARFNAAGYTMGRNDVFVILMGQLLVHVSRLVTSESAIELVSSLAEQIKHTVDEIWQSQGQAHVSEVQNYCVSQPLLI